MSQGKILYAQHGGTYVLKFVGDVRLNICLPLSVLSHEKIQALHLTEMLVDLTDAICIDSTALGLLAKIAQEMKKEVGCKPTIICTKDAIHQILLQMGFDEVFTILTEHLHCGEGLKEFTEQLESHSAGCYLSLCAHKVLMELNEENKVRFQSVVDELERDLRRNKREEQED